MLDRLERIEKRYQELDKQMSTPEIASDLKQLQALAQERAGILDVVTKYREYRTTANALEETKAMLAGGLDEEMTALAKQEVESLESQLDNLLQELKITLIPRDPNDEKDIIVEIRAGAGGNEAGLFAADLFRMYSRYAQAKGWGIDIMSLNESGIGGFKEIIFEIQGRGAYSRLKYESGVHRVQRVPVTESSGRIHTSTATVAVLPKAEEVDVSVNPDDLKFDIFHSGGAGGQNVNKVATAVRITHLPTGIVTTCQDERSQLQNKVKAMTVLRTRLLDTERRQQEEKITQERRSQVGTGDRAEKIRTYNFPQDRISDHRIGLNLHNLPRILEGELDELIDTLATSYRAKQLEEQTV
ncbi:MAG TPA: peptide chain release factor 1 [Dehalococcoidales bacterium]|nr:peptide chain release factor 1 [Dehalococcoidales bacterium]